VRIASSPVYLDTSALAKIYVAEPESDALEAALLGRRDLVVSDLAVTELTSLLARRVREHDITGTAARRLYRAVLRDLAAGEFRRLELTARVHREAERLLLVLGDRVPLRAADALHLALATMAEARTLVTYDRRMRLAVRGLGTFDLAE
jgi:predicted nucleic acid-binding protein